MTPLWVISLFLSLTEVVLGVAATRTSGGVQVALVAFVIAFPTAVATAFFATLWSRPQVLYAPGDYGEVRPSEFVTALRSTPPADTLFDSIRETLQANISSNMMVSEVLTRMELPRTTETERRVEEALEGIAERAVDEIRLNSFVEVDPAPLGIHDKWTLPYATFQTVSDFLDQIWWDLRDKARIPAFTYASRWALRDVRTNNILMDMGTTWAEGHGMESDLRSLSEVGIYPGARLEIVPLTPSRRSRRQYPA
jgi:hypothetical protein